VHPGLVDLPAEARRPGRGVLAAVTGLAAIPARIGARRPAAAILQAEMA
jgi:hypothetical protein